MDDNCYHLLYLKVQTLKLQKYFSSFISSDERKDQDYVYGKMEYKDIK